MGNSVTSNEAHNVGDNEVILQMLFYVILTVANLLKVECCIMGCSCAVLHCGDLVRHQVVGSSLIGDCCIVTLGKLLHLCASVTTQYNFVLA